MNPPNFRVWDTVKNDWFGVDNALCMVMNKSGSHFTLMTEQGPFPFPFDFTRLKLQMFTGLNDIAGKDICEGDIIENKLGCKYKVRWDHSLAGFEVEPITVPEDEIGYFLFPSPLNIKNDGIKVIGNEFENPELLLL